MENTSINEYVFDTTNHPDGDYTLVISVGGFNKTTYAVHIKNPKPPIITSLNANNSVPGIVIISWHASDPNPSDSLFFNIYYSITCCNELLFN